MWPLGAIAFIAYQGCSTAPSPRTITEGPVFERGFQIFPSPRTFDAPGTIFRIDSDDVRHPVADLSGLLQIVPQEEAIPRMTVKGMFNTGFFFSWLRGANRSLQYQRVDSASVGVSGAKREQAFEVNLQKVVDSARHVIDWKKSGKVYLITETILADSVQIHLSTSIRVTLGDSLKRDSASTHGIAVHWEPQRAADLSLHFPKPYRVFYKVEQLVRPAGFEQDSLSTLAALPVSGSLFWKQEEK